MAALGLTVLRLLHLLSLLLVHHLLVLGLLLHLLHVRIAGRGARCNARIDADGNMVSSGEQVELGANERYISLCRKHFTERKTGPV